MRRAPLLADEHILDNPISTPEELAAAWRVMFLMDALDVAHYMGLDGGDAA